MLDLDAVKRVIKKRLERGASFNQIKCYLDELKNCNWGKHKEELDKLFNKLIENQSCCWIYNINLNTYDTSCGNTYIICEELSNVRLFKSCPYCGKKFFLIS